MVSIPACHAGDRGSFPRRGGYLFLSCWPHFPSFLARGFLPHGNESLCLYVLKTVSRGGITFPTPGVESLFRPLGLESLFQPLGLETVSKWFQPQGSEKLFLFWILSPQIFIFPWLGLHKAWNLQMNLGVTLKKNIPQLKSKLSQSGGAGIRTGDLLCQNRRLSRLSYFETWLKTDGKSTYLCWLG